MGCQLVGCEGAWLVGCQEQSAWPDACRRCTRYTCGLSLCVLVARLTVPLPAAAPWQEVPCLLSGQATAHASKHLGMWYPHYWHHAPEDMPPAWASVAVGSAARWINLCLSASLALRRGALPSYTKDTLPSSSSLMRRGRSRACSSAQPAGGEAGAGSAGGNTANWQGCVATHTLRGTSAVGAERDSHACHCRP